MIVQLVQSCIYFDDEMEDLNGITQISPYMYNTEQTQPNSRADPN